jgi:hypothetical protein
MGSGLEEFEKVVEENNKAPEAEVVAEEVPAEEEVAEEVVAETEEVPAEVEEEVIEEIPAEEAPATNPLDELPDDVKEYAATKKLNPDLTFEDFQKERNFDINSLSILDVAREKAIRESNGKITKENVDAYLEKKTGIILTDDEVELDEFDEIDLEKFIGDFRESFSKKPEAKNDKEEQPAAEEELIEIENGFKIEKSIYENLQNAQKEYVSRMENSVAEVNESLFNIEFDNNGTKEIVPISYTTTEADKQLMLSTAKDVNNEVDKMFRDKDGNFNDKQFAESILWFNPGSREKMINALVHKAVAISTEKILKQEYNPNFQGTHFKQEANPSAPKDTAVYRPPGTLQIDVVQ